MRFVVLFALVAAAASCNPAQGLCQKQFDCKDKLKLDLQDDYVAVCAAEFEGANNALRQNAEKECKDLADAEVTTAVCLSSLSCDDLVKAATPGGDTICKDAQKDLSDKLKAADGGAKCDGIADAGEGEGEGAAGEGEGEGAGQ